MVPNSEEQTIKVLGFLLDNKLNLKAHIDFVHSKWPKFGYVPKIGHIWLLSKN